MSHVEQMKIKVERTGVYSFSIFPKKLEKMEAVAKTNKARVAVNPCLALVNCVILDGVPQCSVSQFSHL